MREIQDVKLIKKSERKMAPKYRLTSYYVAPEITYHIRCSASYWQYISIYESV